MNCRIYDVHELIYDLVTKNFDDSKFKSLQNKAKKNDKELGKFKFVRVKV